MNHRGANGNGVTMPALTATEPSHPAVLPDSGFLSAPWTDHTARWACRRLKSSVIVISADLPVRPTQPFASRTPSVRCERNTCTVCGGRLRSAAKTGS